TRLEFDTMAVMELAGDSQFVRNLSIPCLEGYLFPETYFFPWGTDAKAAISETVRQFFSETESVWPDSIVLGLSRDEVIVLASIIEAETALDRERQLVASVYVNRLRRNMKLDADPTVVYGLGELDRPLNRRDLRQDTPYNTYLHRGLPPSAINSPGLASIRAALNPAETDYYYFVADQSGGHKFSRTNAEHNRARRRIKSQKR
ncbi:MAG: endolytic transglycosylase MltG, partial [Candidatus Zixiibacteriota bacterium]